ncbi:hypothetical protein IWW45_009463, partial [Coemansia sp. RSA 485]
MDAAEAVSGHGIPVAASAPVQVPFNVLSPDAWLSAAYSAAGYDKSEWKWVNGQSYLSTWQEVGLGMVVYLATIFGIQFLMR